MTAVLPFPTSVRDDLPPALLLELTVRDAETIAELCSHAEGNSRDDFALKALRIGVLALRQARGQIDADHVRREGDRLLSSLQHRLEEHARSVHERTATTLREYFDPQSGRFQERVNRLIGRDGELEQLLRKQLGADDSELSKTLSSHLGEDSPLLQFLSPDESRGLLASLRGALDVELEQQREHVLKQFSLDNKEGALARFLSELAEHNGQMTGQLQEQIELLVKQFSADEEGSALNRLLENVTRSTRLITAEFSLDAESSALARMKRELTTLLNEHRDQSQKFQEEVKLALQTMVARKQEAARSTRHGIDFEAAVVDFIQAEALKTGDVAEATGSRVGRIKNCKKGDLMIELGPESVAPGARIVVEAKESANYQLCDARTELEEARKNRDASIGVFVFSKQHAPPTQEPLTRVGDDLFVLWDRDDADTDLYLKLGLSVARALAVRQHLHAATQTADLAEVEAAILHIEKATNGLDELETSANTVSKHSDTMLKRIGLMRKELTKQIEVLRDKTAAMKAEATE
jgi:hypothetical protein